MQNGNKFTEIDLMIGFMVLYCFFVYSGSETLNEHKKEDGGQKDASDDFKIKQQKQRRNSEDVGTNNPKTKDIPVSLEEKMHSRRGRVKDFIKIFNIEGSSKRKGIFESGYTKSKEKDGVKTEAEVRVSTPAAEANDKVKAAPPHNVGTFGIYSVEICY